MISDREGKSMDIVAANTARARDELGYPLSSQIRLEEAQQTAVALIGIVQNRKKAGRPLVVQISNRDYLLVEAWEFIAGALGVKTEIVDVQPLPDGKRGFRVMAESSRGGRMLANGYSQAAADEPNRGSLTDAQLLGLAQTRAISRTLRNCLAWVTVMAGYSPTPAEEVE